MDLDCRGDSDRGLLVLTTDWPGLIFGKKQCWARRTIDPSSVPLIRSLDVVYVFKREQARSMKQCIDFYRHLGLKISQLDIAVRVPRWSPMTIWSITQ